MGGNAAGFDFSCFGNLIVTDLGPTIYQVTPSGAQSNYSSGPWQDVDDVSRGPNNLFFVHDGSSGVQDAIWLMAPNGSRKAYAKITGAQLYTGAYDWATGDYYTADYKAGTVHRLTDTNKNGTIEASEVALVAQGWSASRLGNMVIGRSSGSANLYSIYLSTGADSTVWELTGLKKPASNDCGDLIDEDNDGYCENGEDKNKDGDCTDPGENTGPADCNDNNKNQNPGAKEICGNTVDENCDGKLDDGCADTDKDGIIDVIEDAIGTDKNDADSDDDGVIDGKEPDYDKDTDGDGLINALDPDSDNDALWDGLELGLDCTNPATDPAAGRCSPDGDKGATKTDPLKADTDGGGASDGSEDGNLNGVVDANETDPTAGKGADDAQVTDTDKDGLSDPLEISLGSDPNDGDSDDDGLLDGAEPNPGDDSDGDGLNTISDVDSDNDALPDGLEAGSKCDNPATDSAKKHCKPDADAGQTTTYVLISDTDGGGASDGSEDANLNGIVDKGETNPVLGKGADDGKVVDTDGDGLSDSLEDTLGTDKNDRDSDDDGLPDGAEPNPSDDGDGDGKLPPLDDDSDNDGIKDGTEAGRDCKGQGTNAAAGKCIPDADSGATTTHVLIADSDRGGVSDGEEDKNKNGKVDPGERDPNDASDDSSFCKTDKDCGGANNGMVCENTNCVKGCRGTGADSGCPAGQTCTSKDSSVGTCQPNGTGGAGGSGGAAGAGASGGSGGIAASGGTAASGGSAAAGGNNNNPPGIGDNLEGGGCGCHVPGKNNQSPWWLAAGVGVAIAAHRRRRRR